MSLLYAREGGEGLEVKRVIPLGVPHRFIESGGYPSACTQLLRARGRESALLQRVSRSSVSPRNFIKSGGYHPPDVQIYYARARG